MSFFRLEGAVSLGPDGRLSPAGSLGDAELAARIAGYKRMVAGRYRAIAPDEIDTLPEKGTMLVSPKIDGQFWCLVIENPEIGGEVALVSPRGKVISGRIPLLAEVRKNVVPRQKGRLIVPGELFALRKDGRPRHGDVAGALGGGEQAEVGRLGFFAFDLMEGGDETMPQPPADYPGRLEVLRRLFEGGQRAQAIRTDEVHSPEGVRERYGEWVEGGKGEGLVVRPEDGRIFKLKPIFTFDAAVIGFTEKSDESELVRSMLLAVIRDDGHFQLVGSVGNLGSDETRRELWNTLHGTVVESSYRFASSTGALYRFVAPTRVVEVKVTDLQVEDSSGRGVRRMVLDFEPEAGWTPLRLASGVSLIHPILSRVRDDKEPTATDVRAAQVLERVEVEDFEEKVVKVERPKSEVVRREVFTKTTKDKTAVRKLLVWKTNKDDVDPQFPAFVVHWTDYSPGRKEPLQREVRLAPDADAATEIAEAMLADGVKRGWQRVEG